MATLISSGTSLGWISQAAKARLCQEIDTSKYQGVLKRYSTHCDSRTKQSIEAVKGQFLGQLASCYYLAKGDIADMQDRAFKLVKEKGLQRFFKVFTRHKEEDPIRVQVDEICSIVSKVLFQLDQQSDKDTDSEPAQDAVVIPHKIKTLFGERQVLRDELLKELASPVSPVMVNQMVFKEEEIYREGLAEACLKRVIDENPLEKAYRQALGVKLVVKQLSDASSEQQRQYIQQHIQHTSYKIERTDLGQATPILTQSMKSGEISPLIGAALELDDPDPQIDSKKRLKDRVFI